MGPVTESWNSSRWCSPRPRASFLISTLILYPHAGLSDLKRRERYARRVDRDLRLMSAEGMMIVERSSSRVSRSGPRRIVTRIVFGLAVALMLVSARAEPL